MCRRVVTALLLVVGIVLPAACLAQADSRRDKGFTGTWKGDNGYYRKNSFFSKAVWVHDVIQIKVSEDPKGGLIMNYVYGVKGQKGYSEKVRHLVLDPATSRVFMHWAGESDEVYRATGLADFTAKGSGTFDIEGPLTNFPQKYTYKGVFELDGDIWNYHWDNSIDGVNYKTYGTFELHRVAP
jgi:hypothetical protein